MSISLNLNKNKSLYKSEKEVSQHILNKRANAKLNYVVEIYKAALGGYCLETIDNFLDKKLIFNNLRYLKELRLKYKIENRFFAMSYDLIYESKINVENMESETEDCSFHVKLKGALSISGAEFVNKDSKCNKDKIIDYLNCLNNKLILDRIVELDLTDIKVNYNASSSTWMITCRSLIGSTTWNFIPPVFQLITPKKAECLKLIEFFELVFDAVLNNKNLNIHT